MVIFGHIRIIFRVSAFCCTSNDCVSLSLCMLKWRPQKKGNHRSPAGTNYFNPLLQNLSHSGSAANALELQPDGSAHRYSCSLFLYSYVAHKEYIGVLVHRCAHACGSEAFYLTASQGPCKDHRDTMFSCCPFFQSGKSDPECSGL